ncbi:TPA: hypothetical protein ACX3CX_004636 [Vibrio parahaemolyticus]
MITPDSVIEDLTSEIISSPLLDKNRKDAVVSEFQKLHSNYVHYSQPLVDKDEIGSKVDEMDWGTSETSPVKIKVSEYKVQSVRGAEVFAMSATIISGLLASYIFSSEGSIVDKLTTIPLDEAAALGAVIATLAGFITGVIDWKKRT